MKKLLIKKFLTGKPELCQELYDELKKYLTDEDIKKILNKIDNIQENYLYKSKFHGIYHSQKVLLFAYLIGKNQNLNEEDLQIIMDAAVYHDIGRLNESEDEFHGYSSSCRIKDESQYLLTSDIYKNKDNIDYVRAISEAHSKHDEKFKSVFEDYQYENANLNYDRFEKLAKILKDADALDRTRFKKTSNAVLQEKFLRYKFSKDLISFAEKINQYYVLEEIEEMYPRFKKIYTGNEQNIACLHGIGTDFFKLEGILQNGILSAYAQLNENINTPRNFYGSNKELWVSVVDAKMINENGKAFNKYIKKGISLFCFVSKLKTDSDYTGSSADVKNRKEYNDEKYAFERINVEQIHSIIIPKSIQNKKINELNYLICASKYDIIIDYIKHYKDRMIEDGFNKMNIEIIGNLLEEFYNCMLHYESLEEKDQKINLKNYLDTLDFIKEKINEEIQIWFNDYYTFLLSKLNPTVMDVVKYILSNSKNIDVEMIEDASLKETLILVKSKGKMKN